MGRHQDQPRLCRSKKSDGVTTWDLQLSSALGFEAAHAGADLVLDKPVTISELTKHVQTLSNRPRAISLHDYRDAYIARVLAACDGNRSEAARRLRIKRYSLQRILARWSLPAGRRGRRKKAG